MAEWKPTEVKIMRLAMEFSGVVNRRCKLLIACSESSDTFSYTKTCSVFDFFVDLLPGTRVKEEQ